MDALDLQHLPAGKRMKLLRLYVGDSVRTVATRWGKDQSYVYRVERDELAPSPLEIADVERAAAEFSLWFAESREGGGDERKDPQPDALADGSEGDARPHGGQRKRPHRSDEAGSA